MNLTLADDYSQLCTLAAEHFVRTVRSAIEQRGFAVVALGGGSTPKSLYNLLAQAPYQSQVDWQRIYFFWGDERSVGPEHADSNYRMAREALLDKVGVDASKVYRMPADAADKDAAAGHYEQLLRQLLPGDPVPSLDLVHLGMGDDGHTASLFPHTTALGETTRLIVPNEVSKLATTRMTMTYPLLNAAAEVVFLVSGANKASMLARVLEGPAIPLDLPSQAISPRGQLTWMVTRDATTQLTRS
jgi:6-phosphogluconolactonase